MAVTIDELRKLMELENLRYFVAPDNPIVYFGIAGLYGHYQITIALRDNGDFLQIRTSNYAHCTPDHPHFAAIMRLLASVNCVYRLVKLGWDEDDGEIMAYGDLWVMDSKLTHPQFSRLLHNYLPAVDFTYRRLSAVLATGQDPGQENPETVMSMMAEKLATGRPGLRGLLDKLRGARPGGGPSSPPEVTEI